MSLNTLEIREESKEMRIYIKMTKDIIYSVLKVLK